MLRSLLPLLAMAAPAIAAQTDPVVVSGGGLVVVSAEGKVHADARVFPGGPVGEAPGFLLRRARIEVRTEIGGRFRTVVEPEMGEGELELKDGYVEADLWRAPECRLAVRVGQFKTPVGYESLRSSSDLRFAERGFPTALSPRRDLGAMLTGETTRLEAQAGVFNGVADGESASGGEGSPTLDGAARVFGFPLAALGARFGVGLAVAAGVERGTAERSGLDDYDTPGDREFFEYAPGVWADGPRLRVAPQTVLDAGPFHVLGEWTLARHQLTTPSGPVRVEHRAWQAAASVVLAGVPRGDDRPVPRRSVLEGGPGAVEVSIRVHGLALGAEAAPLAADAGARCATTVGVAAHWSPVTQARFGLTAERTTFDPFELKETPEPETFVVLRAQIDL